MGMVVVMDKAPSLLKPPISGTQLCCFTGHAPLDLNLPPTGLVMLASNDATPEHFATEGAQCQLLRQLVGVEPLIAGELSLLGRPHSNITPHETPWLRTKLALLSKGAPLLSVVDVLQNMTMVLQYHDALPAKKAQAIARSALARVGYSADEHLLPANLTALQRLQVGLARALLLNPAVIALECPWFDITGRQVSEVNRLLNQLAQDYLVLCTSSPFDNFPAAPLNIALKIDIEPTSLVPRSRLESTHMTTDGACHESTP